MVILMVILWRLMRGHPGQRVELWLLGLTLVLVEAVAVSIFNGTPSLQRSMHVLALDAYVLAAATFSWAARGSTWQQSARFPFVLLPAVPMLVLCTLYGLDVKEVTAYLWITAASFVVGLAFTVRIWRRNRRLLAGLATTHALIWLPMSWLSEQGRLRGMIYWGLCCLYLLAGFSFRRSISRRRMGGLVIVTGFVIWAGCFALHPSLRSDPVLAPVLADVWDMQKFFVTIGMLLVLLEEQTERSQEQALHDPLTGLPNRRLFDDRLAHALERTRRFSTPLGLFVIDLNGFKEVNDSCGHAEGDQVLKQTALELKARIRSSDTLARLGGDEFCVIMADVGEADCGKVAQLLRDAVARVVTPPECPAQLSASIGYALYPKDCTSADALRNLADARMYEEKRGGSARVEEPERRKRVEEAVEPERITR